MFMDNVISKILKSCPNALAIQQIDMSTHRIDGVFKVKDMKRKNNKEDDSSAKKKGRKSKKQLEETTNEDNKDSLVVNMIWKYLSLGKIDLSYASIGQTVDGRAILDYDILINMLMTYGLYIDDALAFIDDFVEQSKDADESPIIMMNRYTTTIAQEIEPLKFYPDERNEENGRSK